MTTEKKVKYTIVNKNGEIVEREKSVKDRTPGRFGVPSQYLDLGLYLALPIVLGALAGQWLDQKFKTKAVFTIVLLLFGTISVFYNLYKLYGGDEATHKH